MSEAVLNSQSCSAGKLLSAGYKFAFADEKQALSIKSLFRTNIALNCFLCYGNTFNTSFNTF
jgi:hypothetical protein